MFECCRVARPWECRRHAVTGLGTRTHCVIAPLNEVVRQSFIRPRFAPTQGLLQPIASLFGREYQGAPFGCA